MRDPKRIKRILKLVEELWNSFPDQRLFQLLYNYTRLGTRTEKLGTVKDPFHYEDDVIEKELEFVLKELKKGHG